MWHQCVEVPTAIKPFFGIFNNNFGTSSGHFSVYIFIDCVNTLPFPWQFVVSIFLWSIETNRKTCPCHHNHLLANFNTSIMEHLCLRIPHIFEQINELLDDESLIKCKEVSRIICSIIENQKSGKFLTTRMIQCYVKNPGEFSTDWRIIFQKLSAERLSEFGILVQDFYMAVPSRFEENWCPMHIAADRGHLDFCKFIAKVSVTKSFSCPPLLFSVQAGHLEVSKYLFTEIDKKNLQLDHLK